MAGGISQSQGRADGSGPAFDMKSLGKHIEVVRCLTPFFLLILN